MALWQCPTNPLPPTPKKSCMKSCVCVCVLLSQYCCMDGYMVGVTGHSDTIKGYNLQMENKHKKMFTMVEKVKFVLTYSTFSTHTTNSAIMNGREDVLFNHVFSPLSLGIIGEVAGRKRLE